MPISTIVIRYSVHEETAVSEEAALSFTDRDRVLHAFGGRIPHSLSCHSGSVRADRE
jgi:hypothetical protein